MKKPTWLKPIFNNIPGELKNQPWGVWRAEERLDNDLNPTGKYNKAPRNPITGIKIGANKPELFSSYDEAKRAYESGGYTGIGVLLTGNGIFGIDIDDAAKLFKDRPEVKEWLEKTINAGVYCEESPSGKGFRLFAQGELPSDCQKKRLGLEIYDRDRFLTVTGHTVGGSSND